MTTPPKTRIASSTNDDVLIRGKSLCGEIIGKLTFTEFIYFHVTSEMATPDQVAVLDACLVTLAEHGLTPSVLATRLVYTSAPEAMQGAVAAGLLGVGSLFVGTVEGCAVLLEEIVRSGDDPGEVSRRIAREHRAARRPLPGFGHPQHKPDDPRTLRLFSVAEERGVAGRHVAALRALGTAVDEIYGKHITINATGAFAAVLADCGIPTEIMRGLAIIARCAGLVGHLHEEQRDPAMRAIWDAAGAAVRYTDED